jgi:hypothetical protein
MDATATTTRVAAVRATATLVLLGIAAGYGTLRRAEAKVWLRSVNLGQGMGALRWLVAMAG